MTTDVKGTEPFNTIAMAATADARDHESELRALHDAAPEEWLAVRLARYWDGAVTIAIMKPDSLEVRDLLVIAHGEHVEFRAGPGILPALLRKDAQRVEIRTGDSRYLVAVNDL